MGQICSRAAEILARRVVNAGKRIRRLFKQKELSDGFIHTIKIYNKQKKKHFEARMTLDTACKLNLIAYKVLKRNKLEGSISRFKHDKRAILLCLNQGDLDAMGKIKLRWKAKRYHKIFRTTFYVIGKETQPFDVILGSKTIQEHGILKFAGFGAIAILRRKTKEDKFKIEERRKKAEQEAKANDAKVKADKQAKEEKARQAKQTTDREP